MEKFLFQNMTPKEIEENLEANCDGMEEFEYVEDLSADEIAEHERQFTQHSIKYSKEEEALKVLKAEFKAKMDPIRDEKKRLLDIIRIGGVQVSEPCYKWVDREDKMVGFYSKKGKLVHSRPANKQELSQLTISGSLRNGTND